MANLITPHEVLIYSPAGYDYPTKTFCDLIRDVEEDLASKCLGWTLYNYLISKLTPYPKCAVDYVSGATYQEGDMVIMNGCVFISTIDENTDDPAAECEENCYWQMFDRFTDEGARQLWVYLRRLLALQVYHDSLTFVTWRGGRNGVVVHQSAGGNDGWRSGNKGELYGVKADLIKDINRIKDNMVNWLSRSAADYDLPLATACGSKICGGGKRRSRGTRFMFRN